MISNYPPGAEFDPNNPVYMDDNYDYRCPHCDWGINNGQEEQDSSGHKMCPECLNYLKACPVCGWPEEDKYSPYCSLDCLNEKFN